MKITRITSFTGQGFQEGAFTQLAASLTSALAALHGEICSHRPMAYLNSAEIN